jgi:hypothetical protein
MFSRIPSFARGPRVGHWINGWNWSLHFASDVGDFDRLEKLGRVHKQENRISCPFSVIQYDAKTLLWFRRTDFFLRVVSNGTEWS